MTAYRSSLEGYVIRVADGTKINTHFLRRQPSRPLSGATAEYAAWLAAGNVPDPPSAEHRAIIRKRLHTARRDARTEAETSGFIFNGHPFDSDRDSILRITNAAATALSATLTGGAFQTVWRCQDDYEMPLDAAGVMGLQAALSAHGQACHNRSTVLRDLIDAPDADLDALASVVLGGWRE